ncbi:MAG: NFACT family protein [Chthonomonadales bacterium]|nr:NFACT family protein [Chthonomonadales bacterium]
MKPPFDSLCLRVVTAEIARAIVSGVVQRVTQPADSTLVLTVRAAARTHHLLLSAAPAFARAHLTSVRLPNPPAPPAFCMLCRKHLEGAVVHSACQRGFDRILDLVLHSGGREVTLVAELMGKHSNLVLVGEGAVVLDAARRITHRQNRFRETLPGRPYVAPPAASGRMDPFSASADLAALAARLPADAESAVAWLMAHVDGLSPFLAAEIAIRAGAASLADAWGDVFRADGDWEPVLVRAPGGRPSGAYPLASVQLPAEDQHRRASLSTALDQFYAVAVPGAATDAALRDLATSLQRARVAREREARDLDEAASEAAKADRFREAGELLLANLHRVPEAATEVLVEDLHAEGAPPRAIALDPRLTARENAEACFRRYRKARGAAAHVAERRERVARDLEALAGAQEEIRDVRDEAAARALRERLTGAGLLRRPAAAPAMGRRGEERGAFGGKRIRLYQGPEGYDILVGENAEANDYLTTRVAAPNDLWLHVRATTSAHVVVRTANRPDAVPRPVIERAARLAAAHSASKHASLVPVDYTLRKHVRRPRGAAPGTAVYQNEKTIHVEPERNVH